MKFRFLLAALGTSAMLATMPAQAYLFSAVYSFGDSLSDTGSSGLMPSASRPPLQTGPLYADGRSTNGPVAAEGLTAGLGLAPDKLHSYAVGGATSGEGNADVPLADCSAGPNPYCSGVLSQIAQYLADSGGSADPTALYMVLGGSNDFLSLLDTSFPPTDAEFIGVAGNVINNLAGFDPTSGFMGAVATLYQAGARHFLLPLLPNIGAAPYVGSPEIGLAVADVNANLRAAYLALLAGLGDPDVSFTIFDTFGAQEALAPGFADASVACTSTAFCDPDQHFFLDELHPTARVHALLAEQLVAAVPEPATVLLVALGLAGLRRRQASSRAA